MRQSDIMTLFVMAHGGYTRYTKSQKLFLKEDEYTGIKTVLYEATKIAELRSILDIDTDCYRDYMLLDLSVVFKLFTPKDLSTFIELANDCNYYVIFVPTLADEFEAEDGDIFFNEENVSFRERYKLYSQFPDSPEELVATFDKLSKCSAIRARVSALSGDIIIPVNEDWSMLPEVILGYAPAQYISGCVEYPEDILLTFFKSLIHDDSIFRSINKCISLTEPEACVYQSLLSSNVSTILFFIEELTPTQGYILLKNNILNRSTLTDNGRPVKSDKIKCYQKKNITKINKLIERIKGGH